MPGKFTKYVIEVCTKNSKANEAFNKSKESAVTAMTEKGLTKEQQDILMRHNEKEVMAEIGREYSEEYNIANVGDRGGNGVSVFHQISEYK